MHACIFALGMGIPVLGIGYLHKTRGLFRMMELEDWMLDINEVTSRNLLDRYNKLFLQKDEIRVKVGAILPRIISEAQSSAEKIALNYHQKGTTE